MEKRYDIWIHNDYGEWYTIRGLNIVERGKIMEECHKDKQPYIVYNCSGLIVEQLFVENEHCIK